MDDEHVPRRLVYGPVQSRRFGRSLGVSFSAPGTVSCHWRCPYCQLGRLPYEPGTAFAPAQAVLADLDAWLAEHPDHDGCDVVTVAGSGEPLDHPGFPALFGEISGRCRNRGLPLFLLTNGDGLTDPERAAAVTRAEEAWIKWGPGVPGGCWRPSDEGQRAARVAAVTTLGRPRIQAFLYTTTSGGGNTDERRRSAWLAEIRQLRPLAVHLATLSREPGREGLLPVPSDVLTAWRERADKELGCPVAVF